MGRRIGNSPVLAYAGWVFGWVSGLEFMRGHLLWAVALGLMGLGSLSSVLWSGRKESE